jgi:toxin CcdB
LFVQCQSDFLDHLESRFVIPILPRAAVSKLIRKLNPIFVIDNRALVLFPQFALSLDRREIGRPIASLAHEQDRIIDALDMLLSGF